MATTTNKGFTPYIRLLNVLADLLLVTVLSAWFFCAGVKQTVNLTVFIVCSWSIIGYFSGFYDVYRFTRFTQLAHKILVQFALFTAAVLCFMFYTKYAVTGTQKLSLYFIAVAVPVTVIKIIKYVYLKKYKVTPGLRNVLIMGYTPGALELEQVFKANPRYGYNFMGFFSDTEVNPVIRGGIADVKRFAAQNEVSIIYCSLSEITVTQLHNLADYSEETGVIIKIIPDKEMLLPKKLRIAADEVFPVLTLHKTPLHNPAALIAKRVFDIVFAVFVMVFVFSWLLPLVAFFIKIESKGPVFFKQIRVGTNKQEFLCYKFRSMKVNNSDGKLTVKNDPRITRTGKFLRKTSLDEMPQFINVLIGNMSVVGPRPKIWSHHNEYKDKIYKFMDRISVKPGITGMAQVCGYRGEINSDAEMQNRIRYDVFYIENWSMLLDFKIIVQTVVNIFMGEEKAF